MRPVEALGGDVERAALRFGWLHVNDAEGEP
jgi:hypothetical protein